MKWRNFILSLAGAVAAFPKTLRAQPWRPVIGLLSGTDREASQNSAIQQGLVDARLAQSAWSTRVELLVNLRTARAQGLDIPATLFARADGVIE